MILARLLSSSPILLCVLLTGCTHPKKPDALRQTPVGLPDYVNKLAGQPMTITPSPIPSPSWLEKTSSQLVAPRLGPGAMVVFGEHISLHRTAHGMIAVHANDGVIGPVTLPAQSTWAGVDGKDQIWASRYSDGKLWRASSALKARTPEGFAEVKTIQGARAWDASGPFVVVATEQAIFLSSDHGTTWKERAIPVLDRILQIYVRGDGVLVAQGENETSLKLDEGLPSTWLSTTRGVSWTFSPYQPGVLERDGSWIWSGDSACVATLTDDGKAWSANPDLRRLPGERDPRELMLSLTYGLHAPSRQDTIATTLTPSPPRNEAPLHKGLVATCQDPIMSDIVLPPAEETSQGAPRGPRQEICEHISCLRGYTPPPTSSVHESYMLADAQCTWPEGVSAVSDPGCRHPEAKVTRAPHVVLWDRDVDSLEMGDTPEGCTPERVLNSRGLHVLLCRKNELSEVWTRTAKSPWAHEAILEVPAHKVHAITSSEDGTIVLHGACEATGCAPHHIRQPRASGVQDIWAAIDIPQSLTLLPLQAGNALVASQRGDQTTSLQLWFVEKGKHLSYLLDVNDITEPVHAISTINDSTQVLIHLGDPLTTRTFVVQGDGTLAAP